MTGMKTIRIHPLTLALLALVPSAQAQEQDPVELLPTMVVVASRLQEPLAQVQSSVAVVTRDEMEKQVAQDSADMVRYVPGLRVDTDTTRFGSRGFTIRGLGGNRVRTEIDGVPQVCPPRRPGSGRGVYPRRRLNSRRRRAALCWGSGDRSCRNPARPCLYFVWQ